MLFKHSHHHTQTWDKPPPPPPQSELRLVGLQGARQSGGQTAGSWEGASGGGRVRRLEARAAWRWAFGVGGVSAATTPGRSAPAPPLGLGRPGCLSPVSGPGGPHTKHGVSFCGATGGQGFRDEPPRPVDEPSAQAPHRLPESRASRPVPRGHPFGFYLRADGGFRGRCGPE